MSSKTDNASLRPLSERALAALAAKLIRDGRMPSPGAIADALALRAAKPATAVKKLHRSPDAPVGPQFRRVYVSSSQRENSTLAHAKAGHSSPAYHDLVIMANRLPGVDGGENGFGFWKGGAEELRVIGLSDPNKADETAARLGSHFKQKAVVHFTSHPGGEDIAHVLHFADPDAEAIARGLSDRGIDYKTIIPKVSADKPPTHEVHILDFGGGSAKDIENAGRQLGAHAHIQHIGTARFIGGDTREEAGQEYANILGH